MHIARTRKSSSTSTDRTENLGRPEASAALALAPDVAAAHSVAATHVGRILSLKMQATSNTPKRSLYSPATFLSRIRSRTNAMAESSARRLCIPILHRMVVCLLEKQPPDIKADRGEYCIHKPQHN